MRKWISQLVFLLLVAHCLGQQASVSVNANSALPRDPRPFGKYLVEICTLSSDKATVGEERTVRCTELPFPARKNEPQNVQILPKDQTITIKLVCDPATKAPCDLATPQVGDTFFVSATSDSGLPVQQRVLLGNITPLGGLRTVQYRANDPGPIIIRATALATPLYTAAAPVDLILKARADPPTPSDSCPVLPASPAVQSALLDAPAIVSLLGNPTPFIVVAQGPNTIAIYSTRQPLRVLPEDEHKILYSFQEAIAALGGRTAASLGITPAPAKPFSVELKIPHASGLGDLATRIGGLNYSSQFTVQDVGRNWVRITAPTQPDCDTWTSFLADIREMAWQLVSDPMSKKLFYLSSSDVATAFSGLATPAAATPAATTAAASSGAAVSAGSPSATTTPAAGAASSATPSATSATTSAAPAAAAPSTSSNATIAITQPPGSNIQITSDTTACVVAGLAFGNASGCGSTPTTAVTGTLATPTTPAATAPAPAAQAPLAMASVAVAAGTGEQTPPDLLVYSDTNPGDDAQIEERNRILAQLDLPRPEMILSAWVTQNSSASPQAIGAFNNMVKNLVAEYDRQFEKVVLLGWQSVKDQSADPEYFNETFRSYIADRFIADTAQDSKPGSTVQELSQAFLDRSQAKLADPVFPKKRTALGICERRRYCLGYSTLFSPLKPALTNLLLTIIAAKDPVKAADAAIERVQGPPLPPNSDETVCDMQGTSKRDVDVRKRCHAIWRNLDIDHVSPRPQKASCEERDFRGILASLLDAHPPEPRVYLQCFKDEAEKLLAYAPNSGTDEKPPLSLGLFRAAIADFLFDYKMSQQYPHEFVPYDLTQSANALNYAFNPLIDAFNRDLSSYQLFVRADMQYRAERLNSRMDDRCCVKRLFGLDKPSFFNDGLITVRTISGQPTSVSTTSQSFLNGSTAPELPALLNSLAGLGTSGAGSPPPTASTAGGTTTTASTTTTTSGGSTLPASGGTGASGLFGKYGALPAVLANYQTTYAQIGRQLSISATPRSLATASSAEIAVTLNADESASGPLYTGPGATDPVLNTSRVANHDTTTRVRVDSIKLFEVSSFSAIVERSRSRFPLLPPFVEIPYIGTLAGIPLGSAKEFHSSTAIISANVVPTAADIAYGLRFVSDLVVDGLNPGPCSFYKGAAGPDVTNPCVFRKMFSLRDVGQQPIREFNRNITRCFATETSPDDCRRVSFDQTFESW